MRYIAHRSGAALAAENSLAAVAAALTSEADGIEFDVRATADGVPVVIHDDDVARTTGGTGLVSRMPLRAVRLLSTAAGPIPTLEEFLAAAGGRIPMVAELKMPRTPDGGVVPAVPVAEAAAPLLRGVPDVTVSSFDLDAVLRARELSGATAALTGYCVPGDHWLADRVRAHGLDECHVEQGTLDASFVEELHACGAAVLAWTVEDGTRAAQLAAMGVDGIFCDDPDAVRAAVAGG
ncbi:MAG TPA: glycerophosphodiester phosphodiesterase [Actinomycetota bacterium]